MTLVVTANVAGQRRGEPVVLPNRRRRLSTIVARHKPPADRRFIVSVHRKGEVAHRPNDRAVRLRADWPRTLVGPNDVVLITVVPLRGGFASIGLAIASIALLAVAPYAAPAIAGAIGGGVTAGVVQAGLVIGGIALSYAAQASAAAKKKTENPLYSVSGGGNIPKANARRPLLYGRSWSSPPLSQKDYFSYDGDTMVLVKRMTLGIGKFQVHRVRVGDALYWDEATGLQSPFNLVGGPLGAAFEILYETQSAISPGDVITSTDVGGQEMPRPGNNPEWTPWFRLTPPGVTADAMQVSHTYPAIYRVSSAGAQRPTVAAVVYQAREINPNTGDVIGPVFQIWRSDEGSTALTVTPLRRSVYFRLPKANSTYEIRAQNGYPDPVGFIQENRSTWDEMVAFKDDVRIRPQTTEICMRVRAGKGLTVTAFSDVSVDATRIVPVWNGSAWTEQPASKAVWAFCDLVRAEYGLNAPDGVDADKALYYANLLPDHDTYDGQLPEVSLFWEAAAEILHPLRADPVKVGAIHSFVRDESRAEPRHVLTRRQIVRDSGGATYKTKVEGGDVIVEFDRDGDPKRPDEVRYSYGPQTRTPKRYKVAGIRDGAHAQKHAAWLALVAVFRGAERRITTEWDGRLVFPGDHILSDLWFFRDKQAYGVAARSGNVLQLDVSANVPTTWGYVSIRTRVGREWGILRARGVGARGLELHPDDVPALEAQSGISLGAVLATDTQDPTTVVLGDLTELQESYVARSAVPSDADHVQIEMVRDDVRIWQILGETVYQPAPVNDDGLEEPLTPQISVLHARCVRIETGIEVVWGVSATRGARNYEADISYDQGTTWDVLSAYGPASTGRAQMRQVEGPVSVRARAYGRTGLHGIYVVTTFTTVQPVVDGGQTQIVNLPPIDYAGLSVDVQASIDHIPEVEAYAQAVSAQAQADFATSLTAAQGALASAQAADAVARDGLAKAIQSLSNDEVNQAAIVAESEARQDAISATTYQITGAISRIGAAEAAQAVETNTRATADSAQVTMISGVSARVETTIAALYTEIDARSTADTAAASRIDGVYVQVGAVAAGLTDERSARIDAISAEADHREAQFVGYDAGIQSAFITERSNRADAIAAEASYREAQFVNFNASVQAAFVDERTVRGTADTAAATRLDGLSATVGSNTAAIIAEQQARSDAVSASAYTLNTTIAQVNNDRHAESTYINQLRVDGDAALGSRIDSLSATVGGNSAAIVAEQQVRADAISAEASRTEGLRADVVTNVQNLSAGISNEASIRLTADTAISSTVNDVMARTNAGTAVGRFSMQAVSGPNGVLARIQALVAVTAGGQTYGAGYYVDVGSDGKGRFVVDADGFYVTKNGASTPLLSFDGQTLRVPALQLTGANAPPGVANQAGRYEVVNYVLVSGQGTVNSAVDANMITSIPVENGVFPTIISVRGHMTLAPNTQVSGLQLLIDGSFVTNIAFGGVSASLVTATASGGADFSGTICLFLSAGNHTVQFRYSYAGQNAGSKVTIDNLLLAANTPRA